MTILADATVELRLLGRERKKSASSRGRARRKRMPWVFERMKAVASGRTIPGRCSPPAVADPDTSRTLRSSVDFQAIQASFRRLKDEISRHRERGKHTVRWERNIEMMTSNSEQAPACSTEQHHRSLSQIQSNGPVANALGLAVRQEGFRTELEQDRTRKLSTDRVGATHQADEWGGSELVLFCSDDDELLRYQSRRVIGGTNPGRLLRQEDDTVSAANSALCGQMLSNYARCMDVIVLSMIVKRGVRATSLFFMRRGSQSRYGPGWKVRVSSTTHARTQHGREGKPGKKSGGRHLGTPHHACLPGDAREVRTLGNIRLRVQLSAQSAGRPYRTTFKQSTGHTGPSSGYDSEFMVPSADPSIPWLAATRPSFTAATCGFSLLAWRTNDSGLKRQELSTL
ncbi:hypothetical protein OH76DRAFT_1424092 [Lentinus brumalis]|uniref:Uncharacterized protein n=1 Tax=Lentinus brumalis TaxID=2498619 RepID=A0A371CHM4_9APHY|nr:hypothetical protein OH76DRAFT_1424092 [Polyporus brumalis]